MAEGEGGMGGGGGAIEAQLLRFYIEARENVSKVLKTLDDNVARASASVGKKFEGLGDAAEDAADRVEDGWERSQTAATTASLKAEAAFEKTVKSFNRFGKSYQETLDNLTIDLDVAGAKTKKAAEAFSKDIAGLADPRPFEAVKRQALAMAQVIQDKMQATDTRSKAAARYFLETNQHAIREVISEWKKYGVAVPAELKKVEAELDHLEGKATSRLGKIEDLISRVKQISVRDTVLGGAAYGASHYMRSRGEETYGTARDAARVSMGGKGLADQRYRDISHARMSTGANIEELASINTEFSKMSHLGPQSFKTTAEAAMHLARTTDMGVGEAARFTTNLQQMYKMTGKDVAAVQEKVITLSKLSGVSAENFAEIYDELKFARFGLDGNVLSAQKLADSVAEAAAEMGKYGISSKSILSDVKGRMTGGMDVYTKNIQSLVMGGKSVMEAKALLDAEANGDKGATAEIAKTKGRAYSRFLNAGGGGAQGRAIANELAGRTGMGDVEELQKQAAYAKGEMSGGVEKFLAQPQGAEADAQRKAANTELLTAKENRDAGKEKLAGATALSQQGVYELELKASSALNDAAGTLGQAANRLLGAAGMQIAGGAAQVLSAGVQAHSAWKIGKGLLGFGSKAAGVAGEVGEVAATKPGLLARAGGALRVGATKGVGAMARSKGILGKATRFVVEDLGTVAKSSRVGSLAGRAGSAVGRVASKVALPATVGVELGLAIKNLLKATVDKKEAEAEADLAMTGAKAQKLKLYKVALHKAQTTGNADQVAQIRERMHKEFGTKTEGAFYTGKPTGTAATATDAIGANVATAADATKDIRANMAEAATSALSIAAALRGESSASTSRVPAASAMTASAVPSAAAAGGASALATSIAKQEGFFAKGNSPNQGQRNNNPGNIRVYGWEQVRSNPAEAMRRAQKQGASGYDPKTGFLRFDSAAAGFKGLDRQLGIYAKRGMSVGQMVEKYAPPSENNTLAYKASLAKQGFSSTTSVAQALGKGSVETTTPPLGMLAASHVRPPDQLAAMRAAPPSAEPFIGATKGDQAVVAELRKMTSLLARAVAAANRPGRNSNAPSPLFEEINGGGIG